MPKSFQTQKENEQIGLISGWAIGLASRFDPEKVQLNLKWLKEQGFWLRLSPSGKQPERFFAADLSKRQQSLEKALKDSGSQLIWAVRGGWGSSQLLPWLMEKKSQIKTFRPQPLVGFSDITSLMLFWNLELKWPVFHGPMVEGLKLDDHSEVRFLQSVLVTNQYHRSFELKPLNRYDPGKVPLKGLFGGNLTLLAHVWGTRYRPSVRPGWWVVIEEYNEEPYRVDRLMTQLDLAGFWEQVTGVIWAEMLPKHESQQRELIEVVHYWSNRFTFPVLGFLPSGHGQGRQFIYFGPLKSSQVNWRKEREQWQLNIYRCLAN